MLALNRTSLTALLASVAVLAPAPGFAAASPEMKQDAIANVDAHTKQAQVMVDTVFSFAEPGFQELRTSEYLTGILAKNGFKITKGVAGIPTAWTATWGEGGPLIALGSDEDDLRGVSQIPGDPNIEPIVEGAPGHGEGHNSGMPLIITAALAVKAVMEKNHLKGRLILWPGIAEELLGSKAFYVRDGVFKGVDACIFVHVASQFATDYGDLGMNGMVSVEYTFHGKTAHAAGDPWDGHSALDAAEIMDVAWQFRREHLHLAQRSHNVISNGGGQPNIVPGVASTWYYFREHDFKSVRELWNIGNRIADAAAMATDTTVEHKVLGTAAPNFGNKPLAEAAQANMEAVGMPKWSEDDQKFAREVQEAQHFKVEPLRDKVTPLKKWPPAEERMPTGGGSDDVGDIMWTVPTITIRYPSNIPNTIAHNVTAAMAMATPIAHKGVMVGAKAVAATVLDMMTTPQLLVDAKHYFDTDQQKYDHYDPMLTATDVPAIHLNDDLMAKLRPQMEPYYYDSGKYDTYLDQLGIKYPNPPVNGIRRPKPGVKSGS
ncbi:MAG TPA: peptidase dimerization domain-containing protein [Rhizomicrobium sp.]|jgi:aminobenzoyl-glutamate utilization protein B|nr:peptidase dimerization domain-containing protein [Rhizomicrobium sp.]